VRSVVGERVVQLEHVGSTAVPGLCAKPVIDPFHRLRGARAAAAG
jgi:GrpB-like predicted nucleotidyltransferase (UPF0157 family)